MGPSRSKLKIGFGVFGVIQAVFWTLRCLTAEYDYMVLKRIHHLANLEFFMSIASFMIYSRTSELLPSSFSSQFLKSGLILLLLGWQSCFSTHFILQGDEPHWFSIFVMVSAALCVHITAFFIGFSVVESIVSRYCSTEEMDSSTLRKDYSLSEVVRFMIVSRKFHTRAGLMVAFALTALGFFSTALPPRVYHQDIRIRNLPKEFDGFRIALLTDVHIGPTVGAKRVKKAVNIVNSLNPDVVAIAGDLVDGATDVLKGAVAPLKGLKSKHGTYFSTGNHEYYHGNPNIWLKHFETINVKPLHNAHVKLKSEKDSSQYICFAGVDDVTSGQSGVPGHSMNVKQALSGCNARAPTVLLVHQPNGISKILKQPEGNVVDLFLAGHTHGGQFYIAVPFAYLSNAFYLGLYELPTRAMVYVSAGVHFWGPPVKMYGYSEITDIQLHSY